MYAIEQLRYNLTKEELNELIEQACGRCSLCGKMPDRTLVVDHCHSTGKVRGLICSACNSALGFARDNVKTLQNMIDYITKHASVV